LRLALFLDLAVPQDAADQKQAIEGNDQQDSLGHGDAPRGKKLKSVQPDSRSGAADGDQEQPDIAPWAIDAVIWLLCAQGWQIFFHSNSFRRAEGEGVFLPGITRFR